MRNKRRVLIIAEAANPEWPSVPLVGWSLFRAIAKTTNTHLVTHVRNREALQRAGLQEGEQNDFTVIDNEWVASPMVKIADSLRGGKGKGWTTLTAFSAFAYYSFEREVWRKFASKFEEGHFDLVHRITPLSPTHQSIIGKKLAKLEIPFVIGPLNGGLPWPKNFVDRQHAEHDWLSHVRSFYKGMPYYRQTRQYSSAIIVGSKHTREEMPDWARNKCVFLPENGVDPKKFNRNRNHEAKVPLRAGFVGRLVAYKGADFLIEAAAEFLRGGLLTLDIVGDGPEKSRLHNLAADLGVTDHVRFHGGLPHELVQDVLSGCDFFAFPSIREFGGGVVVEAMALGVAPVVADYGGPSELLDNLCGVRVPFADRKTLVEGFREAIARFISNPEVLDSMGVAARKKVAAYLTWDAKAQQIGRIYDLVLSGTNNLSQLDLFPSD